LFILGLFVDACVTQDYGQSNDGTVHK